MTKRASGRHHANGGTPGQRRPGALWRPLRQRRGRGRPCAVRALSRRLLRALRGADPRFSPRHRRGAARAARGHPARGRGLQHLPHRHPHARHGNGGLRPSHPPPSTTVCTPPTARRSSTISTSCARRRWRRAHAPWSSPARARRSWRCTRSRGLSPRRLRRACPRSPTSGAPCRCAWIPRVRWRSKKTRPRPNRRSAMPHGILAQEDRPACVGAVFLSNKNRPVLHIAERGGSLSLRCLQLTAAGRRERGPCQLRCPRT